jgi:virulence factor Mce-like protein
MNRRRSSLAANPVLVGAAAILIAVVAVVISYNANSGLPFVQTYDIDARVADAKKLTTGTDVRIAGKRVGQVNGIDAQPGRDGRPPTAILRLSLDRTVEPLPRDTTARIRPRSVIGAKFVELVPGDDRAGIPNGGTIAESRTSAATDLDEVTAAFDAGTRRSVRRIITGVSDGVAGRAGDLGATLDALPGTAGAAARSFRVLAGPATDLGGFLRGTAALLTAIEPVAGDVPGLARDGATTFGALADEGTALRATLRSAPPMLDETRRASVALRPVLRDTAALAREIRPGVRSLRPAARDLRVAAAAATPVLRRARILGPRFESAIASVARAIARPTTATVADRLRRGAGDLLPVLQEARDVQAICNYVTLFARNVQSTLSDGDRYGNWFRAQASVDPTHVFRGPSPSVTLHDNPYPDASRGGCTIGNEHYRPGGRDFTAGGAGTQRNPTTRPPAGTPEGPR